MDDSIGLRIRNIRGKESRASFAERLKIGTTTLQRYENNERSPDIEFLTKIQSVTGYSLDYLVYGKEIAVPADESLILERYRQASVETRNKVLMLLLGSPLPEQNTAIHNPVNSGSGSQTNVVNNNSGTQNFHKESGFSDLPFAVAAAIFGFASWGLSFLANHISTYNRELSFDVAIPGMICLLVAGAFAVFATEKRKMMDMEKAEYEG